MTTYLPRSLEAAVARASAHFPVVLVTGPRQVGKTSLLRHLARESRTYVTLDEPVAAALARDEPALFLRRFPPPVLIDEVQYAPQLLPHIKMAVDTGPRAGDFWLTGSQQFHLMRGVSESLAGRVAVVQLQGFSQFEVCNLAAAHCPFLPTLEVVNQRRTALTTGSTRAASPSDRVFERIWRGSFPAFALQPDMDRDLFYGSYVQTYLQRDVRDLARVGDSGTFLKFLRAAAARSGQLLNVADMARDCDIAPNTAKSWLSVLEATGLVMLLQPWSTNLSKRLVKAPKLYVLDTGLCCYLTRWPSPETLEAGAMAGAMLETFVVAEIARSWLHAGKEPPMWFYRDKDKVEIDILLIMGDTAHPVEVKATAAPTRRAIRHFGKLERAGLRRGEGAVTCLVDTMMPLTETDTALPVGWL